ncbi:MAG: response regulator [Thermonemataceae bacterium]
MNTINNVWVIDDNSVSNLICKALIKKEKFAENVSFETSAERAIDDLVQLARERPEALPEVIFLDLNLPLMNGWEFMREFLQLPQDIQQKVKVYILSSSLSSSDREKAEENEALSGFYTKPLSSHILQEISFAS